ncbi:MULTISPECIES: hypothetical protein [Pedobacter]|uniref:Uncharacterized protein n=1 Tax=Pedobacter zeae TaxID=1737356 RepID=A0A7W6P7J0_9SPHI|nr:hypothetical protein [Pedobacter zeae]MBB4110272.1 hypothetical protein [Pedobacter zeae]GGH17046.1 hypothetical protein GCM10007422_40150 [Pedobacter zeae]
MKTSIYNKAEHTEGYVGPDDRKEEKSDVQKAYEAGNDVNEVTAYGKEPSEMIKGNPLARDGFDNSGTQGKDSLSDDAYNSPDKHPSIKSAESRTGSSSEDFKTKTGLNETDEDHALNTGI